jgi:serine/threonine-protein kinase
VRAGATVDLVVERQGVRVPGLTGDSREVALRRLREANLRSGRVTEVETDQYAPGTVIDQSRAVQSLVDTGTTVDLTVAIAVRAPVPSLVGMTLAAATRALAEAGLATGRVTEQTTFNTRAGTVLSQSVAARTRVTRGTVVDLTVATAPPFCTVPNLVNLTEAQAREALAAAGLREGQIQRLPYPPRNTVTSQGTQAGSRVDCGTAISFMTGTIGEPVRVDPEL